MKFCVIGLGRFGYQVATTLADKGMDVLAVDSNESIISSIRDYVTHAICIRVIDESSLRNIGADEMDTVIVAMGESFAQSILITALLKKHLQTPVVITRATNDLHKEILKLVGADQVVLPEKEIGIKLADNLSSPFTDLVRLTKQFAISMIQAPASFVGKRIKDLKLFELHTIQCIGIKDIEKNQISVTSPDYMIRAEDRLVFAGKTDDLESIADL